MKRTDLAMIVLIAAASAGIAYFIAQGLFGTISTQSIKVKTVDPITSIIQTPDKKIFNSDAINPSVEVTINNTEQAATNVTTPSQTPATTTQSAPTTTTNGTP